MKISQKKRKGCCSGKFDFDTYYLDPRLFTLKVENSKKNINKDNYKKEKRLIKVIKKKK